MSGGGRVLVTGGTGAFGTATTRWLTRLGHEVVVMARRDPMQLPAGAVFRSGDIRDLEAVRSAMQDCDVVAHFAWTLSGATTHEQAAPLDLGGTENVLRAMQDTSCGRLVFASSITAYGGHPNHPQLWSEDEPLEPAYGLVYEWHKAQAERMIVGSGVEAVRVRPTAVVGRDAFNGPANVWRQPVIPDLRSGQGMQLVHQEDVGRFFALACLATATGAVNLAADDILTWKQMAALARRPRLSLPSAVAVGVVKSLSRIAPVARSAPELLDIMLLHWPNADTARLRGEFGFRPAWSSAEALGDLGRTSTAYHFLGMKAIRKPLRLDRAVPVERATADDAGQTVELLSADVAGEFDTRHCDPRYPEWTGANLAEAFPGPLTPLSLHLAVELMFTSADIVARVLPLDGQIRENVRRRQLGVFGHRIFHNISVLQEMVVSVPGQTVEDFDHQINGQPYPDGYKHPRTSLSDLRGYARFAAAAGLRLAGLNREVSRVEQRARELVTLTVDLPGMGDERLLAHIGVLWDDTVRAWQVGNLCTFLVSAPTALLERRYGSVGVTSLRVGSRDLPSARLLGGIRTLAGAAKADSCASALLRAGVRPGTWETLQREAPAFAGKVQELLDRCGHRGPGETELANDMYADDPDLLLRAVAGSLDAAPIPPAPARPGGAVGKRLAAAALGAISRRERCRDAVTLMTHQLRRAVRERGERLVAQGVIAAAADVFYLTPDQMYAGCGDLRDIVERRRAERQRLAALTLPIRFMQPMDLDPAGVGEGAAITGTGASPGVARGRVRHLRTPDDELEPGEVLLASATDTGWTPFFGMAAGVVTDIGGLMSHASIVAREFGIPAVVGANGACARLRDGQLVEVDGTAGTVTVLDES